VTICSGLAGRVRGSAAFWLLLVPLPVRRAGAGGGHGQSSGPGPGFAGVCRCTAGCHAGDLAAPEAEPAEAPANDKNPNGKDGPLVTPGHRPDVTGNLSTAQTIARDRRFRAGLLVRVLARLQGQNWQFGGHAGAMAEPHYHRAVREVLLEAGRLLA